MQFELDFNQPIPAPVPEAEPERRGELVVFPLTRNLMVQTLAARLRSIRNDAEQKKFMDDCARRFFRSRRDDGLTFKQAHEDVMDFEKAIRAEYRRPTPPPTRWRDRDDALIPFDFSTPRNEASHAKQTA
ncbi:DUF6074 family protein [Pseudochrobactrum sp. B5]|uniref:DUF6074 family protein n=1 Tax=Pseudochrobactrum sp. B5 TaxID=1289478 RepID=UPI000952AE7A|nr:DUF6074 family protein [Pseudochrobactrum sp. B5]